MFRGLLALLAFFSNHSLAGDFQILTALPDGSNANAVQVDSSGNIYVAGEAFVGGQASGTPPYAFVTKFSPDGSQMLWQTNFTASGETYATALALDSAGSVYVTGSTEATDFPTTKGSLQPTGSLLHAAFAAKLSASGAVVYATYLSGSAETWGTAIAVDAAGDAFITGFLGPTGAFPTSPGAVAGAPAAAAGAAFVIELDPSGSFAPVAVAGFGGSAIAVDAQGNIYAAGAFNESPAPATPGAFQSTFTQQMCEGAGFFGEIPCGYQHVAKIDPTGTRLLYATYVAGTWGATPFAIAVDSAGNAILAGTTNSPDYPTTPDAYQPEYFASPYLEQDGPLQFDAPPAAGYVTKLNASGTALLWSTFFAGSGQPLQPFIMGDSITGMGIDSGGNILITGLAFSSDIPGLWSTPVASRTASTGFNYVARLTPDGALISPTRLLPLSWSTPAIAVRADGSAVVIAAPLQTSTTIPGSQILSGSVSSLGRVVAITDPADYAKLVSIAPGQVLALFGDNLAPLQPGQPPAGFPTSFDGVTITFNGIAAPLLYAAGGQINLQVPYEIAGQTQVTMQVSSQLVAAPFSESYTLAVAAQQPSVFLSFDDFAGPVFGAPACGGIEAAGVEPLALNEDGTLNSCANPAAVGSVVTLFLNGVGVITPAQTTGAIAASPTPIAPAATLTATASQAPPATIVSTSTVAGALSSVAAVQIQVAGTPPYATIPLSVAGTLVRQQDVVIWLEASM
jgi:uncharacterized protein (TIGR03437 family)